MRLSILGLLATCALIPTAQGAGSEEQARISVQETLRVLIGQQQDDASKNSKPKFTAAGCSRIAPDKWAKLLLMNQPIYHELKFGPGCDLKGKFRITQGSFPIDLFLKNAGKIERIRGHVRAELTPRFKEQDVDIQLHARNGVVSQKKEPAYLGFNLEYALKAGLDGKLKENQGGNIKVDTFRGKKVSVTERFRVD